MKRKTKYKINILNRSKTEWREFENKLDTPVDDTGKYMPFDDERFAEALDAADWTDDPGTGRSILLEDGRELLNPVPIDPPVGHDEEPSINALVERALAKHMAKLEANKEAERTLADVLHFEEDGWDEFFSPWELQEREMVDEVPPVPVPPVVAPDDPPVAPVVAPKVP
ncbi:MAG: hypothetical protein [Microvirus sp.]|nr:MAG: hypothetical protein [Microvirus sp.]